MKYETRRTLNGREFRLTERFDFVDDEKTAVYRLTITGPNREGTKEIVFDLSQAS
jgi:hypothetical protein